MKIRLTQGNKNEIDRLIWVSTELNKEIDERNYEAITHLKCGLLLNQLSLNERNIYKNVIGKALEEIKRSPLYSGKTNGSFFFKEAMIEAINMGAMGINWAESHNKPQIKEWCRKWGLTEEAVDEELKQTFQTGIHEY